MIDNNEFANVYISNGWVKVAHKEWVNIYEIVHFIDGSEILFGTRDKAVITLRSGSVIKTDLSYAQMASIVGVVLPENR